MSDTMPVPLQDVMLQVQQDHDNPDRPGGWVLATPVPVRVPPYLGDYRDHGALAGLWVYPFGSELQARKARAALWTGGKG